MRVGALALVLLLGLAAAAGIMVLSHSGAEDRGRDAAHTRRPASGETHAGELRISRDFGAQTLLAREVVLSQPATVMSVLADNAEVETAYGGGFVNAIDGLASGFTAGGGVQADWFYYVNGMQADRGATDYELSNRDRVWWDYHRWDQAPVMSAVVGQYPQPFLSGAGRDLPTVVQFSDGFSEDADAIVSALKAEGVARVSAASLDPVSATSGKRHVILVGTQDALGAVRAAAGVADVAAGGAIIAIASAQAPDAAIWLVTGFRPEDVRRAANLLRDGAPRLQGRFGIAVDASGVVAASPNGVSR